MTITDTTAPATRDLRALTDEQLQDAWNSAEVDNPAVRAMFLAEFDQRTAAERMGRARAVIDAIRADAELDVEAQYRAASEACNGQLVARTARQRVRDDHALWRMPEDRARRLASPELLEIWDGTGHFVSPRRTAAQIVRARLAENRAARAEARASTEGDNHERDGDTAGTGLADPEAGALQPGPAAPQAPQAGPRRAVQRGGRDHGTTEDAGGEAAGGRPGRTVQPGLATRKGREDMGPNREDTGTEPCILDEVAAFLEDYVAATQAQRDAMTLYAAATHALHVFPTFGRMLFTSEQEASGKTMAMMITAALSANPLDASGTSYALQSALAEASNTPEQPAPTLYLDEISSVFGRSGLAASRNPIADILRKGYKKGATGSWSVNRVQEKYSIYTPFLMAGLRVAVPRDIRSRSVCVVMQPGSPRRYFDAREAEPDARELSVALGRAVRTCIADIDLFRARDAHGCSIHPRLKDRRLEIWEPLCAVAYILGGQRWLNRCISAFKDLALAESDEIALTPRQQTIKDVAGIAASSRRAVTLDGGAEFIGGLVIVDELKRLGAARYQGRTEAGLALLVSDALPMNTVQLRVNGERVRGYYTADIAAVWDKIRPDEPEDVEIPEEVNPFEVAGGEDEEVTAGQQATGRVSAGQQDVTAGTGARKIPALTPTR